MFAYLGIERITEEDISWALMENNKPHGGGSGHSGPPMLPQAGTTHNSLVNSFFVHLVYPPLGANSGGRGGGGFAGNAMGKFSGGGYEPRGSFLGGGCGVA